MAPAARAAPSIDEESPPQDINCTPEQCSTGFEWPNKSSTPVDSLAESSLGNWKLTGALNGGFGKDSCTPMKRTLNRKVRVTRVR